VTIFYRGMLSLILALSGLLLLSGCSSLGLDSTNTESLSAEEQITATTSASDDTNPVIEENVIPVSEEAKQQFAEALTELQSNNLKNAELLFQQMTVQYPALSGPYLNLGLIYYNAEAYDQAIEILEQARTINSNNRQAHNLLGVIARKQGRFEDAVSNYDKAIAVEAGYADAHLNLGIVYELYMGRLEDALAQYQIYLSLTPEGDKKVSGWVKDIQRRLKQRAN
jgi:tetratricopeptide (TPR) repeat protein